MRAVAVLLAALLNLPVAQAQSGESPWDFGGHIKYRFKLFTFPDDSVLENSLGSSAVDHGLETPLRLSRRSGGWEFQASSSVS